jgi:dihydroorotate dehydrogenase (fumarate)
MADLSTKYLGLELKSPIIVGSCGLTSNLQNIKEIADNGAGAVVLKSIFEEEILIESQEMIQEIKKNKLIYADLSETIDYVDLHHGEKTLNDYLKLIKDAKKAVSIPIIASINCISDSEWSHFATKIQEAGADALELNIFLNPTNFAKKDNEKVTFSIIKKVLKSVSIPVAVKISNADTNLAVTIQKIAETGVAGIVLFNRFYSPDFDIENFTVTSANVFSQPEEQVKPLRWISLLSEKVNCSLAASTGIHYSDAVIKQILAGADAVQIVSTLYLNGIKYLKTLHTEMDQWMIHKGIFALSQIKGKMSYSHTSNPAVFERMQFMKRYSRIG